MEMSLEAISPGNYCTTVKFARDNELVVITPKRRNIHLNPEEKKYGTIRERLRLSSSDGLV